MPSSTRTPPLNSDSEGPPQGFKVSAPSPTPQKGEGEQGGDEEEEDQQREDNAPDEYLVSCRCESAKSIYTLLSCLRHASLFGGGGSDSAAANGDGGGPSRRRCRKGAAAGGPRTNSIQPVKVFCSPTSLMFHAYGKAKQTQASVDIQSGHFTHYRVADQIDPAAVTATATGDGGDGGGGEKQDWQAGGEFCVNLTTLLECLHVLGSQHLERTKLCLSYNLTREILKLELLQDDSGVLSTAAVPGMLPSEDDLTNSLALAFRSSMIAARIIVKSETLVQVVQEIELVSGATVGTVSLGSTSGIEVAVVGHFGECLVSVPARGSHVVSQLELPAGTSATPARNYPLHSLLASLRALEIADETCISINSAGMMAIQHQVLDATAGDGNPNFVDFIMCCLIDDEDEDEEDDDDDDDEEEGDRQPQPSSHRTQSPSQASQSSLTAASQSHAGSTSFSRSTARSLADDDDDDDDEEEDEEQLSHSAAPLFGTLARTGGASSSQGRYSGGSQEDAAGSFRSTRRRTRRGLTSNSSRGSGRSRDDDDNDDEDENDRGGGDGGGDDGGGGDDDDEDEESVNLLASDDSDDQEEGGEESQPLDVTEAATPVRHRRDGDDDCSSPELVYGRQH